MKLYDEIIKYSDPQKVFKKGNMKHFAKNEKKVE